MTNEEAIDRITQNIGAALFHAALSHDEEVLQDTKLDVEAFKMGIKALEAMGNALNTAQHVGSVERTKGHWQTYKDEHLCSVCKGVVTDEWYREDDAYDYCPWCGADMRGDNND